MIKPVDIPFGLLAVLEQTNLSAPVMMPGYGYDGGKPYFEVTLRGGDSRDPSLKGGQLEKTPGIMQVTAVTENGIGILLGKNMGEEIKNLFPMGRRITIDGGEITIRRPVQVIMGYEDNNDWRTPSLVFFEAS